MASTYDLIATATPAGTTTATFNNLGSYTDLILQCYMASTANGTDIYMRINGDTASNYYAIQGNSTGSSTFDNAAMNGGSGIPLVGLFNSPQGSPDFNLVEITIPEYRNTNVVKNINTRLGYISNPATPAANVGFSCSHWRNSNAITTFDIFVTGGTFATGSTINLYGVTAGNA